MHQNYATGTDKTYFPYYIFINFYDFSLWVSVTKSWSLKYHLSEIQELKMAPY